MTLSNRLTESGSNETFDSKGNVATYVGIAKYYDNRKCVVTSSLDDLRGNTSAWDSGLSTLTRKRIYSTVGIITNETDWNYIQYWLDQGYTEAASHSQNHVHVPYTGVDPYNKGLRISYEWQINGSKQDIMGNLSLPNWWRKGGKQYVYVWIEPFGSWDSTVRMWLGKSHYLVDRGISSQSYDLASWDSDSGLFNRIGYTVEMGSPQLGGDTSVSSLNSKFDKAYNEGKVYHFITHPSSVDWSGGGYADRHTDYISNRKDVWYVSLGLLYLYDWVDVRNVTQVSFTEYGKYGVFKVSINQTVREIYGVSYPITYMFNIPQNWTSGYVYYRYREEEPWILMANKSSEDFFNGVDESRFNFSEHKVYVSAAFTSVSDNIYLQIRQSPYGMKPTAVTASVSNVMKKSLNLIWTANADPEFARYEVFRSTANGTLGISIVNVTNIAATSLNVVDLSQSTTYYFTVRVWDTEGLYTDSTQVSATTAAPPTPVTVIVSDVTENSLKLIWTQSSEPFFARYEISQSTTQDQPGTSIGTVTNIATISHTVTDLSPGTTYYFTVRVVDVEELYAESVQISATTVVSLWQQPWFVVAISGVAIAVAMASVLLRKKELHDPGTIPIPLLRPQLQIRESRT